MLYQGPTLIKEPQLRWPIVLLAAIITAVIALTVGAMHYLTTSQPSVSYSAPSAAWTSRIGQPGFEQYRKDIVVSQLAGKEKLHPFNNLMIELTALVTNRTNRVITGLEMRGAILDSKNSTVQQRTVLIVPEQQKLLEVNEAITVRVLLKRMDKQADRAHMLLEVTAVRFEQ